MDWEARFGRRDAWLRLSLSPVRTVHLAVREHTGLLTRGKQTSSLLRIAGCVVCGLRLRWAGSTHIAVTTVGYGELRHRRHMLGIWLPDSASEVIGSRGGIGQGSRRVICGGQYSIDVFFGKRLAEADQCAPEVNEQITAGIPLNAML